MATRKHPPPDDLREVSSEDRRKWLERLPVWASRYIELLEIEAEDLQDELDGQRAQTLDESLAASWRQVAVIRAGAGDAQGATRARRAATLVRSDR